MGNTNLHIVSFAIPFPANYGGVIDVFYKLKALHATGVKIHLHCFAYDRPPATELYSLCEKVYYYPRNTSFRCLLGIKPYIVLSRKSEALLQNLLKDDYPILFEGLHSCYYLSHPALKNRLKIYRESNIEHHYYFHLFKAEKSYFKKLFFIIESLKLKVFQRILQHANHMLVVSEKDTAYLQSHFRKNKVEYLPSFHPNNEFNCLPGKGNYAIYHGKLSVAENYKAAEYLIREVFAGSGLPLVIAGLEPPQFLQELAASAPNIRLAANPSDEEMFNLIRNAQVNILITFQATGLKLKLLNTLYNGKFVLVNKDMITGTGLNSLCSIANSFLEMKQNLKTLFEKEFDVAEVENRRKILETRYSNKKNADRLLAIISCGTNC